MAGGFRMGPFELMDLVGIDVGFTISKSFFEQSFGEPRWRPSPLAARAVAAGRLGRKTGEGWYRLPRGPAARTREPPEPGGGDGLVVIAGESALADGAGGGRRGSGLGRRGARRRPTARVPFLIVDCGATEHGVRCRAARSCCCATPRRSPPGTRAARAPASTCCRRSAASPS